MGRTYKYLGYFLFLLIPLIFAGFYKPYFKPFPNFGENIDAYFHIQAIIAATWVAILIVQPFLIVNKKVAIHRAVGKLSYFVFPLLIISFIPRIIKTYNAGDFAFLFFPIGDGSLLILFYALAIYYKKKTTRHMRYMIASALVLMGPTFGRIGPGLLGWSELRTQNVEYAIIYSILIGLILYDLKNKRKYQPYLIAIAGFIIHQLVYYVVFL
jgi:hypothetical protein